MLKKTQIVNLIYGGLILLVIFTVFSSYIIFIGNSLEFPIVRIGHFFGDLCVALFFLSTYPGIFGRFGMKHPLITIGMMFRRQVGISVFLFALTHALIVYIVPGLTTSTLLSDVPIYVYYSVPALILLFFLFLTSNNFSMKKLGGVWKTLHKSVYIIYWLIFLHVMFREVGVTGFLIGLSATLEVLSLVYDFVKNRTSEIR